VTPTAGRTPPARPPVETQPERTALSWQRTGLGVMAVAGLLGHHAIEEERPVLLVLAGAAALLGLLVLGGLAPVRYRDVRRRVAGGTGAAAPRLVAAATAAVLLVGAVAAVVVVLPR
jgi:putative membrane protein